MITPFLYLCGNHEVIALLKLQPVFAEVDPGTFCIVPADIEKRITSKTKAITLHLYGQSADMDQIMEIADGIPCLGLGITRRPLGPNTEAMGAGLKKQNYRSYRNHLFFPSKNLGAYGDGGAMFTNDDELAGRCG